MSEKVKMIGFFKTNTEQVHDEIDEIVKEHLAQIEYETLQQVLADTKSPPMNDDETVIEEKKNPDVVIETEKTPHSNKRPSSKDNLETKAQSEDVQPGKTQSRQTPLPLLRFADSSAVWLNMVYKEEATMKTRSTAIFADRVACLPRMRAILLDWIMEVCEVYRLRRTTYNLTVDYVDRYLTIRPNVPKTQLQLLGVSCLFVAAKLEEIYPPKLSEFSYVCDGACTEAEILACELLLLNTLTWDVNPMTPTSWLSLYMQILQNLNDNVKTKKLLNTDASICFQFPQYSAYQFVTASHLLDLFSMDPGYLKYSYSVIAASAMYYIYGKEAVSKVSGLSWDQFKDCVKYMSVFQRTLKQSNDPRLLSTFPYQETEDNYSGKHLRFLKKRVPGLIADEMHCYQTHVVDMEYFEKSTILRTEELGFTVNKLKMKKPQKLKSKDQDENEEGEKAENETVVIYEIENPFGIKPSSCVDENNTSEDESLVSLFKSDNKVSATFDDLLSSMYYEFSAFD